MMTKTQASAGWIEAQSADLYDEVDMSRRLPRLRRELSDLVGAAV
jgi:hypothetical protein